MNIIESIKAEQDIIYCDITPAIQKIQEYKNSTEKDTTAIEKLNLIVEKIIEVQEKVNNKEAALVKTEVEDIRKLIGQVTYHIED